MCNKKIFCSSEDILGNIAKIRVAEKLFFLPNTNMGKTVIHDASRTGLFVVLVGRIEHEPYLVTIHRKVCVELSGQPRGLVKQDYNICIWGHTSEYNPLNMSFT